MATQKTKSYVVGVGALDDPKIIRFYFTQNSEQRLSYKCFPGFKIARSFETGRRGAAPYGFIRYPQHTDKSQFSTFHFQFSIAPQVAHKSQFKIGVKASTAVMQNRYFAETPSMIRVSSSSVSFSDTFRLIAQLPSVHM